MPVSHRPGQRRDERGDIPVVVIIIVFVVAALITSLVGTVTAATSALEATSTAAANTSAVELATSAANAFYGTLEAHPTELDNVSSVNPTPAAWPWVGTWARFAPGGQVVSCPSKIDNGCFELSVSVASSGSTAAPIGPSAPSGQPQQAADLVVKARVDCKGTVASCQSDTITQHLRRRTFLDYLYFVNHNSLDPSVVSAVERAAPPTVVHVWKQISYPGYDFRMIANRSSSSSSSIYAYSGQYNKMIRLENNTVANTQFGQLSAPLYPSNGTVTNLRFTGMIVYRSGPLVYYTVNYSLTRCFRYGCTTSYQSNLDGQDTNQTSVWSTPLNQAGYNTTYSPPMRYSISSNGFTVDKALTYVGGSCMVTSGMGGLDTTLTPAPGACSSAPNPARDYSTQGNEVFRQGTAIGSIPSADGYIVSVRSPGPGVVFVRTNTGDVVEFLHTTKTIPSAYHTANPAYQGSAATGDRITGPIHTNSGPIPVCGSPIFTGRVEVSGAQTGSGWVASSGSGCTSSAPTFANRARGVSVGSPVLPLPSSDASLGRIAAAGGSPWSGQSGYSFNGSIKVTIDGTSLSITDSSGQTHTGVAFPTTGAIYATGNIAVSGTNGGRLTLAAGGSITVDGNLDYACAGPGVTLVPASCSDVTGLVAKGNIWLYDTGAALPSTADLNGASLTVDAAMLSLANSVDATGAGGKVPLCPVAKLSGGNAALCPTLTVNGAMTTNYRGLFGFYAANSGRLVAGWHKAFFWDGRLFHDQPPWFLSPLAGQWVRSSPVVRGG